MIYSKHDACYVCFRAEDCFHSQKSTAITLYICWTFQHCFNWCNEI